MDIGTTLARIFPTGVVSHGSPDQGGFFKALSLPQGTRAPSVWAQEYQGGWRISPSGIETI